MQAEPMLRVGLRPAAADAEVELEGAFELEVDGEALSRIAEGTLFARPTTAGLSLSGSEGVLAEGAVIRLLPSDMGACSFLLRHMTVGVAFHWQHEEDLRFRGNLAFQARDDHIDVIDEVPLEQYLTSVVSSEMSASCPEALLQAHAVISRSWLLAQLEARGAGGSPADPQELDGGRIRDIRWYDREDHGHFDVCADDHCQRYQGITRTFAETAERAVQGTRGVVLQGDEGICDARFSKCCGGQTELFSSCWGDEDPAYLQAFHDSAAAEPPFRVPLTDEQTAARFIHGTPDVWCNTEDRDLLERLLPDLDHETADFFRWQVTLTNEQLQQLLKDKGGWELGRICGMRALERGPSARIVVLAIEGERTTLEVGKELEIRRLLSDTHLYSSAFTIHPEGEGDVPERFVLRGAGWGHGVGLCQIGAAVMADRGFDYRAILQHYYRGAVLDRIYG